MLNLIADQWLPAVRRHSGRCVIRPSEITSMHNDDPVIAIDWPRPDFRVATLELLTGLLATAVPPSDSDGWGRLWHNPPRPEDLDSAFAPFAHAFDLDGDGPRFMQDFEDLKTDAWEIERLLIESPGKTTRQKNADLLVHRDRFARIGRPAAAIALYALQAWAPSGGAGNLTGMRGGGPLVTMVLPGDSPTLWQTLWANVPEGSPPDSGELGFVFPWLRPTVVSGKGAVTPKNSHPLLCWWGMPRRIRLDFEAASPEPCGITGDLHAVRVVSWRQRPHGAKYAGWVGTHPLTPTYRQKLNTEWLPVHPQPGGIGYQHWLGLVTASLDQLRMPATIISHWRDGRGVASGLPSARIYAAGYDMDKAAARSFVESEMPLSVGHLEAQERQDALAGALVESADQVVGLLRSAVRNALFSAGASVDRNAAPFQALREQMWAETEPKFFAMLETAAQVCGEVSEDERLRWRNHLMAIALRLFDEAAPISTRSGGSASARIGYARRYLGISLAGYGPAGVKLFETLRLPPVSFTQKRKAR